MKESGIVDLLVLSGMCGMGTANKVKAFEIWCMQEGEAETLSFLALLLESLRNATKSKGKESVIRFSDEISQALQSL